MHLTTRHASLPREGARCFRLARPARITGGLLFFSVLAAGCAPVETNGGGVQDGAAGTSGGACKGSGGCAGRSATRDASEDVPVGGTGEAGSTGTAGSTGVGGSTETPSSTGTAGSLGMAGTTSEGGGSSAGSTSTTCGSAGGCGGSSATPDAGAAPGDAALVCIGPTVSEDPTLRLPGPRPDAGATSCGAWALTNGVCCAQYCSNDDESEDCSKCGGPGSAQCTVVSSKACTSGQWPEVHCVSDNEPWHYSRSTHFGLTYGGACAFGLYGLCTTAYKFTDGTLQGLCTTFCTTYPDLCADPPSTTLRGNFAAPDGDYYTQFWPDLPGDNDNYLSCGECFQLVRTQKDGTDYQAGDTGYTAPITLQIVDSCPCSANSKWCCGSGRDHCGEVSDFAYGCPLPPSTKTSIVPLDHDPLPNESLHLDLSDIAMSRLQTGDANGMMVDGVIPTRYRRTPCPVKGNIHILLKNGGEYYFSFSVVNMAGLGSLVSVEARLPSGEWVALARDPNYTPARPQERFGTWVLPQGKGPFTLPLALRFTDPAGNALVSEQAVKSWTPPATTDANLAKFYQDFYYIDTGVQF
jgi:Expansin C-terminal domain